MVDEFEDHNFVFADDLTRFRFIKYDNVIDYDDDDDDDINLGRFKFRTDDNLLYNKKSNIPVCVISLCSVINKKTFIIQYLDYKNVFMKMKVFKKYKLLFVYKYKRWLTLLIIKRIEISY